MTEERRRLAGEYEQRIRFLSKELDECKKEALQIQEQASVERQKQEEINVRMVAELNSQVQDLQTKLSQAVSKIQDNKVILLGMFYSHPFVVPEASRET